MREGEGRTRKEERTGEEEEMGGRGEKERESRRVEGRGSGCVYSCSPSYRSQSSKPEE